MSIDVAITAERNVIEKEAENILKHKDLSAPVECESKSNTSNNRATGTVSKSLTQYLSNVTGKARNQGIAHNCTQTVGVAAVKVRTYCKGEITLHVAQTVNTDQLQHCVQYKQGLFVVCNCK
jgi:hypothetical protein